MGWDLTPGAGGAEAKGRFSLTGKSVGREGEHLTLSEEGETASLCQTRQSETYTDCPCHIPACPRLGCVSIGAHRG